MGTEENGHCREVEKRVNEQGDRQKSGHCRKVEVSGGLTVSTTTQVTRNDKNEMSFISHSLDKGISASSVLCNLHFSTPISELSGKGLFGCLSPMTDS